MAGRTELALEESENLGGAGEWAEWPGCISDAAAF
jgi:hypothetical protein